MTLRTSRRVWGEAEEWGPVPRSAGEAGHGATRGACGADHRGLGRKAPSLMTPMERMSELGAILATGYRRVRLSREKGLAERAEPEAPCGPPVNAKETA